MRLSERVMARVDEAASIAQKKRAAAAFDLLTPLHPPAATPRGEMAMDDSSLNPMLAATSWAGSNQTYLASAYLEPHLNSKRDLVLVTY